MGNWKSEVFKIKRLPLWFALVAAGLITAVGSTNGSGEAQNQPPGIIDALTINPVEYTDPVVQAVINEIKNPQNGYVGSKQTIRKFNNTFVSYTFENSTKKILFTEIWKHYEILDTSNEYKPIRIAVLANHEELVKELEDMFKNLAR